ncbi:MAG: hypothetical protein M3N47_11895 [Chloroflexota bacterium]|nr:hypothetical protein [Chloroflexota bacterium]
MHILRERIKGRLAPRPLKCRLRLPACLGRRGELAEHIHQPVVVLAARLQHPLVVEVGEYFPMADLDRLAKPSCRNQGPEGLQVAPDRRSGRDADAIAGGDQRIISGGGQPLAQRPDRRPQAGPSASVEDVGPKARRDLRAAVTAAAQREPCEQRSRAASRHLHPLAIDCDLKLAQQPDAEHVAESKRP